MMDIHNKQQQLRILIVEDDEDDFILINDYIQQIPAWQCELTWVKRYDDAVVSLCSNQYTLCFCDYLLGAKNGIDLIRDVQEKKSTTPIILLTGKGNYSIDIEATRAGAFDYLIKSELDEDKLERTIRYTLERTNILQKIRESERRYRNIFERSKDIIFIAKADTTINTINYAVTDILSIEVDECIGVKILDLFKSPIDAQNFLNRLEEDGELENYEVELKTKDDSVRTCHLSASYEIDSENERYIQGIIYDVTDIKKAEAASMQAEKLAASGRFIRTLAHEVRNPLNNIKLAVEFLFQQKVAEDDIYLDIIQRNGQRISDLITELLQSSRQTDLDLQQMPLETIILGVVNAVKDRALLRNIQLNYQNIDSSFAINADAPKLEMALLNIVINAIEAVKDEEGVIDIFASRHNKQIYLYVKDNGSGISAENKSRLFEPYFTSKRNGMGLGLATTLNIIRSHNAAIEVQSEEGRGTIFTIAFSER